MVSAQRYPRRTETGERRPLGGRVFCGRRPFLASPVADPDVLADPGLLRAGRDRGHRPALAGSISIGGGHARAVAGPAPAAVRSALASWRPAAVVAVTNRSSRLAQFLTRLLGRPAFYVGRVLAWRR